MAVLSCYLRIVRPLPSEGIKKVRTDLCLDMWQKVTVGIGLIFTLSMKGGSADYLKHA